MTALADLAAEVAFSRKAAELMNSDAVVDLPADQLVAIRNALDRCRTEADLPDHLKPLFDPDLHAQLTESIWSPVKHPRGRAGRWIGVPHLASGPVALTRGKRAPREGRKSPVKATAKGWLPRVEELRKTPIIGQEALLKHRHEALMAQWKYIIEKGERVGLEKGDRRLMLRTVGGVEGYDAYEGGKRLGWTPRMPDTGDLSAWAHFQRAVPGATDPDMDFLDDWSRPTTIQHADPRGFQTVTGDPGSYFEQQHARIMEAGAAIDAEANRVVSGPLKVYNAAVAKRRQAERLYGSLVKQLDAMEWQLASDSLTWDDGWEPEKATPAKIKKMYLAYQRESRKPTTQANWDHLTAEHDEIRAAVGRVQTSPKLEELRMRMVTASGDRLDTKFAEMDAARELRPARREAVYAALKQVRAFPDTDPSRLEYRPSLREMGGQDAVVPVSRAQYWLPSDWIRSSNAAVEAGNTLDVALNGGRGVYKHHYSRSAIGGPETTSLINISVAPGVEDDVPGMSVAVHELVHRAEYTHDGIRGAEWTFYSARVAPYRNARWEDTKSMSAATGSNGYRADEVTREDSFVDPYCGKTYGDEMNSSWELLSMGIEDLVSGRHGIILHDEEYRHFVLGSLALL